MIRYKVNAPVAVEQFIDVLQRSTLSERRPIDDRECMEGMMNNSNLLVTAWDGDQLVGVARSMTDFHYACYLSDLAVDQDYHAILISDGTNCCFQVSVFLRPLVENQ